MAKRYLVIVVFSLLMIFGVTYKVQAAEVEDSKVWERIPRDGYADYVVVGDYAYYFTNKVNTMSYKVYRQNIETGKTKCILKYNRKTTYGTGCTFYTNGKKLVYEDSNLVYCVNADGTGSKKKVIDLRKEGDDLEGISLYGNKIYYSTYHTYTTTYKSYSINITGKDKKVISKSYAVSQFGDRYFIMQNKNGGMAVYDALKGKIRTLFGSGEGYAQRVGDYWYYLVCKDPDAKVQGITLYKKNKSGKGTAKKLASFSDQNVIVTNALEITEDGVYFSYTTDEVRFYSLKKKKFKKTDRNVWYYIADGMKYR